MQITKLQNRLKRRIARLKERLKQYDVPNPTEHFTFWGGRSCGYMEGQISIMEDILDDIEDGLLEDKSDSLNSKDKTIIKQIHTNRTTGINEGIIVNSTITSEAPIENPSTMISADIPGVYPEIKIPNIPEKREKKEVPPEMLENTF